MRFVEFALRRVLWVVFLTAHTWVHITTIWMPWSLKLIWFVVPFNAASAAIAIGKKSIGAVFQPRAKSARRHSGAHQTWTLRAMSLRQRVARFVKHHSTHHRRFLYGRPSDVTATSRSCDPERVFVIAKSDDVAAARFGILAHPSDTVVRGDAMGAMPPHGVATHRPTVYDAPLYNRHIGTILGAFRPFHGVRYTREALKAADGCTLMADWSLFGSNSGQQQQVKQRAVGVIVIIPGLASSSESGYIQTFVRHATDPAATGAGTGFHVCVLNTRGMGTTPLDVPRLMCASFTADVRHALATYFTPEKVRERVGEDLPLFAVGFSLGANVLVKYLGEEGASREVAGSAAGAAAACRLTGAAAVCAPWDMLDTHLTMSGLEARLLYQPSMTGGLIEYVFRHADVVSTIEEVDVGPILRGATQTRSKRPFRTVQEFDQHVIVPHFGYTSVTDYYADSMCFPFVKKTPVPLLCLAAIDDPITGPPPADGKWRKTCEANDNVVFVATRAGGHIGFLGSPVDELLHRPNFMERYVVDSLRHLATKVAPRSEKQ